MILGEDAIVITKEEARKIWDIIWNDTNFSIDRKKYIEKWHKVGAWEVMDALRIAAKDKEE